MKKSTFLFSVAAAAALLAASPSAKAVSPILGLANPTDTFSFDVSGFNSAGTVGYLLTPDETATFGATTTFTAAGINGQDITITSSETVAGTSTTDTFTVTTPTSFLTTAKVNGTTIAAVQLDIGNTNAGGNTVDYLLPIASVTSDAASVTYGTANTVYNYTPALTAVTLSNGNMSVAIGEGINFGAAISSAAPHSLTFSFTYPTLAVVPEPSTWAICGLGLVGGAVMIRRRRLAA